MGGLGLLSALLHLPELICRLCSFACTGRTARVYSCTHEHTLPHHPHHYRHQPQGLSHYLEHMLFMGSEKYPDENDYDAFLTAHGGASNACTEEVRRGRWWWQAGLLGRAWRQAGGPLLHPYTSCSPIKPTPGPALCLQEVTSFYFDVKPDTLRPALDRFAQFFIAPLVREGVYCWLAELGGSLLLSAVVPLKSMCWLVMLSCCAGKPMHNPTRCPSHHLPHRARSRRTRWTGRCRRWITSSAGCCRCEGHLCCYTCDTVLLFMNYEGAVLVLEETGRGITCRACTAPTPCPPHCVMRAVRLVPRDAAALPHGAGGPPVPQVWVGQPQEPGGGPGGGGTGRSHGAASVLQAGMRDCGVWRVWQQGWLCAQSSSSTTGEGR